MPILVLFYFYFDAVGNEVKKIIFFRPNEGFVIYSFDIRWSDKYEVFSFITIKLRDSHICCWGVCCAFSNTNCLKQQIFFVGVVKNKNRFSIESISFVYTIKSLTTLTCYHKSHFSRPSKLNCFHAHLCDI